MSLIDMCKLFENNYVISLCPSTETVLNTGIQIYTGDILTHISKGSQTGNKATKTKNRFSYNNDGKIIDRNDRNN